MGNPNSKLAQVKMLEDNLIGRATGQDTSNEEYERLRAALRSDTRIRDLLPNFVNNHRNLDAFWPYIKAEFGDYASRRRFISNAFNSVFEHLEHQAESSPSDDIAATVLKNFDSDGVQEVWTKALERRETDPEGAITVARTLLETVIKCILDRKNITYGERDDLPKLYSSVAKSLNLSPSQHSDPAFKSILGGATNVVNGIGTLRNRLSDSHGRGERLPVRPTARHAKFAVNSAGNAATFLVETFLENEN